MLITYTPADGSEKKQWEFKPGKLLVPEAEAIEKLTGLTYTEFGQQFTKGSQQARRALVYVLLKREQPTLRYPDVVFPVDAVEISFDVDELATLRARLESTPGIDPEERAHLLAEMDNAILEDGGQPADPKGLADVPENASATSVSSPTSSRSRRQPKSS